MVVVCIAIYIMSKLADKKERVFDHSQQTTKDYSLQIRNPPKDAKNEEEWKTFFSHFGTVVSVTIVLDNEELLLQLLERRKLITQLEDILPPEIKVDPRNLDDVFEHALPLSKLSKCLGTLDGPTIQQRIREIDEKINNDLSLRSYDVSEVFVIFDNEKDQQNALQKLKVPLYHVHRQNFNAVEKPEYIFQGKTLLNVADPPEPSNVIWHHLSETASDFLRQQTITFFVTAALICLGCAAVIYVKYFHGPVYGALAVSIITSLAPTICQSIIQFGEAHPTEESRQVSLFCKTTAFLWVTATVLTTRITPFTRTLGNEAKDLIPSMYAIFITELLKTPIKQILDIWGNIKKHILAPRAPTLKKVSKYFRGTAYELSERYTDQIGVVFMAMFYSLLFPAGYFLAGTTLAVHYWVDKFCLLRVWSPAPQLGSQIGRVSRNVFLRIAIIAYVMKSAYDYASFPFDDACGKFSFYLKR
jgi:hypothetical protein